MLQRFESYDRSELDRNDNNNYFIHVTHTMRPYLGKFKGIIMGITLCHRKFLHIIAMFILYPYPYLLLPLPGLRAKSHCGYTSKKYKKANIYVSKSQSSSILCTNFWLLDSSCFRAYLGKSSLFDVLTGS